MAAHRNKTAVTIFCALLSFVSCGSPEPSDDLGTRRAEQSSEDDKSQSNDATTRRRKVSTMSKSAKAKATGDDETSGPFDLTRAVTASRSPAGPAPQPVPQPAPQPISPPAATPPTNADPAISDCHKGDEFTCKVEFAIVRLTNEKRSGMSPLRHDKNLAFVSRDWSREQSQVGAISHSGFPGARNALHQQEFGAGTQINAENVAMFSGGGGSPEDVAKRFVDMWYNSAGHRANMLGPYQRLGAGVYRGPRGFYGTQIFGR
ncbi:MAG: CAP domain-containing protein [Deltaproteobacteria bacterium]|nr:CAP domain-containing protein [Deltaproteobacteria bacterium]